MLPHLRPDPVATMSRARNLAAFLKRFNVGCNAANLSTLLVERMDQRRALEEIWAK